MARVTTSRVRNNEHFLWRHFRLGESDSAQSESDSVGPLPDRSLRDPRGKSGAYIHANIDNDNKNSEANGDPVADFSETSEVVGEDDLKELTLAWSPVPTAGDVVFELSGNVKCWKDGQKKEAPAQGFTYKKEWDLTDQADRDDFINKWPKTVFVEGARAAVGPNGYVIVGYRPPGGTKYLCDRVDYQFLAALCGRQPKVTEEAGLKMALFGNPNDPTLVGCEWSIIGEPDSRFNCIGYSLDYDEQNPRRIVDVGACNHNHTVCSIDAHWGNANGVLDFPSEVNKMYEVEKKWLPFTGGAANAEALFYWGNYPATGFHAARRYECPCGCQKWIMYASKLGDGHTIEHIHDQLNGSIYGVPVMRYK